MTVSEFRRQGAVWNLMRRALVVLLAAGSGACAAASRAPDPARPRGNEPPYPVVLAANAERREGAVAAWAALGESGRGANSTAAPVAPELQPVTATLSALPANATLMLPLVEPAGAGEAAAQEARRESLRRFIEAATALLGVKLSELSLIDVKEEGGGRRALYQQHPFSFPLRGGYGRLEIAFTPDRRIVSLSSTAIPDVERLGRALNTPRTRLTAVEAVQRIAGRVVTYDDAAGRSQSITLPTVGELAVRELVVYPLRPAAAGATGDAAVLELHIAWEVAATAAGGGPTPLLVYLDAVTGEIIAAVQASDQS